MRKDNVTHLIAAEVRVTHEVEGQGVGPTAGWCAEVELDLLQ